MLCILPAANGQPIRISDGTVFNKVVLPILQEKCMKCHGPNKAKGKLKLHTMADVQAAEDLIIAGNLNDSLLTYRISLPLNDPDDEKMPPSDEANQLTVDEIWLIKWWIQNGASYDLKLSQVENTDTARMPLLRTLRHYAIFPPGTAGLTPKQESSDTKNNPGASPPGPIPSKGATTTAQGLREWGSIYEEVIHPILEDKCVKCHGSSKSSGKLRLDSKEGITTGGKNAPVIIAGNVNGSLLVQRISLPMNDPDDERMPPSDENKQLSPEEMGLIKWWIQSGARFDQPLRQAPSTLVPAMRNVIAASDERKKASMQGPQDAFKVATASKSGMKAVEALGVRVVKRSEGSNALTIHCDDMASEINDESLRTIASVGPQVAWLNLGKTRVTDSGLANLSQFPEMRRLHLDRTKIGDAGMAHVARLPKLEYLNLYDTGVTDTGFSQLAASPSLQKIYAGKTKVTEAGVAKLQSARPGIEISIGYVNPPTGTPAPGTIGSVVNTGQAAMQVDPTPVNSKCPIKPTMSIDPTRTAVFEGKTIGFCCGRCLASFNDNPSAYIAKVVSTRQPNMAAAAAPANTATAPPGTPQFGKTGQEFLKNYCVNCHSGGKPKGDVSLEKFRNSTNIIQDRKTSMLMINVINNREMPPKNKTQPTGAESKAFTDLVRSILNSANNSAKPRPVAKAANKFNFGVRTWTNNTGRSLQGSLFSVNGPNAVINIQGINYTVPINSLSAPDQQYVQQWKTAKGIQ